LAGTVDVTVVTPSGISPVSSADQFTYFAAAVTGVSPAAGPSAGGTTVTITGTGFTGAMLVAFGSLAASSFTVNSDTQITATSPAEPAGTVGVTVVTPSGISRVSSADTFTYLPAPLIVTAGDWTSAGLTLTLGSDGNLHVYTTGTTTPDLVQPCPPASVSNIEITSPSDTTANLTIDSTAGNPIPAGGMNYSGGGGLIITGPGTVTLSGMSSYTGGSIISSGTLLVSAASALPDGGSLTVDAGGTFIFDPSQSASSASAAGVVASATGTAAASETSTPIVAASVLAKGPVAASVLSTLSPRLERQVKNLKFYPNTLCDFYKNLARYDRC
jgi:autotransporter-associated beta strand protein